MALYMHARGALRQGVVLLKKSARLPADLTTTTPTTAEGTAP